MARMTLGLDIFECICGELVVMSRKCPVCGRTNADVLTEKAKAEKPKKPERSEQPKKRQSKYREPAKEGTFITSFLFRNEKK